MAFELATYTRSAFPLVWDAVPGNHKEVTGQTGDVAVQTLAAACQFFRAIIYQKTYTESTDTLGVAYELRGSTVVGMTTNLCILASQVARIVASATAVQCLVLYGVAPTVALQYVDVNVTLTGDAAVVFDVMIDGV